MAQQQSYVIIGNGIAGVTAAEILRAEDPACALTIVADDPFPAYYRPALKDFLGGRLPEEKLWARPRTFYQDLDIRFIPARVTALNPQQHALRLHNGKTLRYHKLLLANGARPRTLTCAGLDLDGVFTLRTVADYQQVLARLERVSRVVVCGSGTLALESAETLRQRGLQVVHLLRGKLLWSEVLDPVASDMVLQEEQRAGIEVRTEEEIARVLGEDGQVHGVLTTRGEEIPCELVLIAIGIEPAIECVRAAGIACGRGVRVDQAMRTSSPDIYAAGDVVEMTDRLSGRARVVGQWFPAIQQAQIAAYAMLAPQSGPPTDLLAAASAPFYNATFLYGLDFVALGLTTRPATPGFQEILAEPQPRSYRKVILQNGCMMGALLLGDRRQALALKRALDHRVNLAPVARQLFAEDFKLDAWLTSQGVPAPLLTFLPGSESAFSVTNKHGAIGAPPLASNPRLLPDTVLNALPDEPALVLMGPDGVSRTLPLIYKRRYLLGRDARNDIVLPDPATSRQHAELFCMPSGGFLRDLDSRYGVFVNQERINAPARLAHGDYIVIGNTLIYFSHPQAGVLAQPARSRNASVRKEAASAVDETMPVGVGLEHRREIEQLDQARLRFEIDMCIGCNRCMDACPVPGSSLVTIAALNAATVTQDIPLEVARFTHECVMCGSCVPVCPVDNHRDLLMLSLKQRLGVSWEARPNMEFVARALPGGWSLAQLLGRLREQAILRDPAQVHETYLLHMIAASRARILKPQEMLLREGEYGRDLYLILEGQLELTVADRDERQIPLAVLRRGEYTGEDGMLTGQPYKATARAQRPTLLFQVPEQVMQRLMEFVPAVRQHFEGFGQARSLYAILKHLELFEGIAETDLQRVIRSTRVRQYERGERLFAESRRGRPARETLHILLEGFVKVARQVQAGMGEDGERIIAYRQGGDYFAGGLDLLGDGQPVTVTTINRCRVAEVPRQAVLALFQRYPEMEQRFALRLREYLEAAAATREQSPFPLARRTARVPDSPLADPDVQAGLHELVRDGVVEGTEVLVIDLDKCIHCNECEDACERRHGHSRMNRKGMVVGNISIATACRQCQDPVCMLCSRAGIDRRPNGEVYITESCIGCGICAERCPYGAISIAQVEDDAPARGSWQRFGAWFGKSVSTERTRKSLPVISSTAAGTGPLTSGPLDIFPTRGGYDELRKKIAIKCDLCAGYRDQACVQACPTGAAIRIQPTSFFGSTEEILRKHME